MRNEERINVFYGGAGSGKSFFVVQKMVLKYLESDIPRTCMVCRKDLAHIRDSIFEEFLNCLRIWGIYEQCHITNSVLSITLPNGSKFIFKGLDDREKIKSISGIDDIVIEEATQITMDDYTQLNLRLRSKAPNQQIILMFNPVSKLNWVYKHFFEGEKPKNCVIVHTTWRDNKALPPEYLEFLAQMKVKNPSYYKIYVEGKFATLDKLVYNNWEIAPFDFREVLREHPGSKALFGLDFGLTK